MDKQKIMDDVIAFFSGSVVEDYSDEAISIMNEYSMDFAKSDADYDSPEGAEELDGIIDDCVEKVFELYN